jgi:hypothetical protein
VVVRYEVCVSHLLKLEQRVYYIDHLTCLEHPHRINRVNNTSFESFPLHPTTEVSTLLKRHKPFKLFQQIDSLRCLINYFVCMFIPFEIPCDR